MSRLIDADALAEKISTYGTGMADPNIDRWTMLIAAQMVNDAPTVDAVEAVRCKDCKYYAKYPVGDIFVTECSNDNGLSFESTSDLSDNHWCCFGERRTE